MSEYAFPEKTRSIMTHTILKKLVTLKLIMLSLTENRKIAQ